MYDMIVIGGGYAGRMAAVRAARRGLDVVLVDPRETFTERVRWHRVACGEAVEPRRYDALVGRVGATFVRGAVVDAEGEHVALRDGRTLRGRVLVWALGRPRAASGEAIALTSLADAVRLQKTLAEGRGWVTVVGAGGTGIELAGQLAGRGRQVRIVAPAVLPDWGASGRQRVLGALHRLGIDWVEGRVSAVHGDAVEVDGVTLPSAVTVDCTGPQGPRIPVDPTLRDATHPTWVRAGDHTIVPSMPWITTGCVTAMPLGAHAATVAEALVRGTAPPAIDWGWVASCVEVGSRAVVQLRHPDGTPRGAFGGPVAGLVKRAILAYVHQAASLEAQLGHDVVRWRGGPRQENLAA